MKRIIRLTETDLTNLVKRVINENKNDDETQVRIIYTVIPYFSNGVDIDESRVKSFTTFESAENYTWKLDNRFDLVHNELI